MPTNESGSNLIGFDVGRGRGRTIGRVIRIADKLYLFDKNMPLYEETRRMHLINDRLYTVGGIVPIARK